MRGGVRRCSVVAFAVLVTTGVGACSGADPANRFGGDTITIRVGTSDGLVRVTSRAYAQQTFLDQVDGLSAGRIRVEVVTDVGAGEPDAESQLVSQVASGELDAGYPATRAFAAAGFEGLEAIEAPFTLTNLDAVEEVLTGRGAELMRESLDGTGLRVLAFAFDGLRVPFAATEPLRSRRAWAGTRFRAYHSPVQEATVEALGGVPVPLTHHWAGLVEAGELDGVELSMDGYVENSPVELIPAGAPNVVLWPKVFAFVVNEDRFESLSSQHQAWLVAAARRASAASFAGDRDDIAAAADLCADGVELAYATPRQLAALRAAVAPVHERLAADPESAALMREVVAAARRHPGVTAPALPRDCSATDADPEPSQTPSELPDGAYRVQISATDVADAGFSNGSGWSGIWTLDVRDATYALTCHPFDDPAQDCGLSDAEDGVLEAGRLVGDGGHVQFVSDFGVLPEGTKIGCEPEENSGSDECGPAATYGATWSLDGETLTFTDPEGDGATHLVIAPWLRIS